MDAITDLYSLAVSLSTTLISLPAAKMDAGIESALGQVGHALGDDRAFLTLFSRDGESMDTLYEWCAEGIDPQAHRVQGRPLASLPWLTGQLRQGNPVVVSDVDALPPEAALDHEEYGVESVRSILLLPLRFQGRVVGMMGFHAVRRARTWPAGSLPALQLIADLFTGVLARKQAEEDLHDAQVLLEKRVEERTQATDRRGRAANALRDILQVLNSDRSLPDVLNYIVVQSCKLLNASATLIRRVDLDQERVTSDASYQVPPDFDSIRETRLYYNANDLILMSRRPVLVADIRATYAPLLETAAGLDEVQYAYVQALLRHYSAMLSVPLFIRDEIFGSLVFFFADARGFSEEDIQLAMALGDQAALAIENARLYREEHARREETERRRQVAEGLRDVLAVLNSNLPLELILRQVVVQATNLLRPDAVVLYRLEEADDELVINASEGLDERLARSVRIPSTPELLSPDPLAISDARQDAGPFATIPFEEEPYRIFSALLDFYPAFIFVPLVGKDNPYGALALYYCAPRSFTGEEIGLAVAFADQASLAIENARLRSESAETAVLMERNRLARDLHDAVTQTLFSASLIAEVLPRIWQRDPEEGWRRLEELRQLSRGALAEMRTLLLELRPSALTEARLSDLLRQLGDAFSGRARLALELAVEGDEFPLMPEVQVFFYRIAQEALNNILKHSGATRVDMDLIYDARPERNTRSVCLRIHDNGRGFDPASVPPNHLGLGIMQERAHAMLAEFTLTSAPGQGTTVEVTWLD